MSGKNLKNNTNLFHFLAEKYREQDKLILAKILNFLAILNYQINKNYLGLSNAYQSLVLIYKHQFLLSKNNKFIKLAQRYTEKSLNLSLAKKLTNIYTGYFRLGEVFMLSNNFSKAILNYQKALATYPKNDSEKGDYQYHLGEAQYRNGDKKDGLKNLLDGLNLIQKYQSSTDPFLIHVWESGCLMRLTELLVVDNPTKAKKYLKLAQKIIQSDNKLIIRRRQFDKLAQELKYGSK